MIMNRAQRRAQASNKANGKAIGSNFSRKYNHMGMMKKAQSADKSIWTDTMRINPKIKLDQEAAAAPFGYE